MAALRRIARTLFVRFPLWCIDATLGEVLRKARRGIDRLVRRYAPWLVLLGVLALLHATGNLPVVLEAVRPFFVPLMALVLIFFGLKVMLRSLFKKGGKR